MDIAFNLEWWMVAIFLFIMPLTFIPFMKKEYLFGAEIPNLRLLFYIVICWVASATITIMEFIKWLLDS